MNQQHRHERARIRAAMDRLLAGHATVSNCSLTPQRPTSTAWPSSSGTST